MALLERAIFELWGDVTSAENRAPPPVTSCHLLGVPPSLPLWGDVIYGWSLEISTTICHNLLYQYSRDILGPATPISWGFRHPWIFK